MKLSMTGPRFQLGRAGPGRYGSRFLRAGPLRPEISAGPGQRFTTLVPGVCCGNSYSHVQGTITCSCPDKTHVFNQSTKTCNPATECREENGLQVGSDGVTCTSIPEAKRYSNGIFINLLLFYIFAPSFYVTIQTQCLLFIRMLDLGRRDGFK